MQSMTEAKTAKPIPERVHGTSGGYTNWKCRCPECREAFRIKHADYMRRRKAKTPPEDVHGTLKGYHGWGCRCQPCREANGRTVNAQRGASRPYESFETKRARIEKQKQAAAERKANRFISYDAAHRNIRKMRGLAKNHMCEFCGDSASDWALIVTALKIETGSKVRADGSPRKWSRNVNDYRPLCRMCHRQYDNHANKFGTCVETGCELPEHASKPRIKRVPRGERGTCENNHDLTAKYATRLRKYDGSTECVECARDRVRRYRAKKRAAL